jgi:hypothetical protein
VKCHGGVEQVKYLLRFGNACFVIHGKIGDDITGCDVTKLSASTTKQQAGTPT